MFVHMWVSLCDRVLQRGRLAARVWTLHASFIPLTSDKAEALLVMMWLLLPIMPRCRLSRKTVRYILFVPHWLRRETSTLLFMKRSHRHTYGTLFTKLFCSSMCDLFILSRQLESITMFASFMLWQSDSILGNSYSLHTSKYLQM